MSYWPFFFVLYCLLPLAATIALIWLLFREVRRQPCRSMNVRLADALLMASISGYIIVHMVIYFVPDSRRENNFFYYSVAVVTFTACMATLCIVADYRRSAMCLYGLVLAIAVARAYIF